jgi:hypothetical protein
VPADGILRSSDGFAYAVTPDDAQWLARAAKYEGRSDARFTIWALAQRFVEIGGPGTRYPTFKHLIRAYAQPVNPIWMRDGSMCRPGGDWYGRCRDDYCPCEEPRLQVRDRAAVDPSSETMPVVQAWLRGEVPNEVPRAVHYAAGFIVRPQLESGELPDLVRAGDGNWYATTARSAAWPRSYVTISGVGERSSWGGAMAIGLAVAAVAIGAGLGAGVVGSIPRSRFPRPRRRRR